jgi:hypothetical protein
MVSVWSGTCSVTAGTMNTPTSRRRPCPGARSLRVWGSTRSSGCCSTAGATRPRPSAGLSSGGVRHRRQGRPHLASESGEPAGDCHLRGEAWSRFARHDGPARLLGGPRPAGCPWVTLVRGLSMAANEPIRAAVFLVQEDGSKESIARIGSNSANSPHSNESMGNVLGGSNRDSLPGISRAEDEPAARRGRAEPAGETLARQMRAASVASRDEAELRFVAYGPRASSLVCHVHTIAPRRRVSPAEERPCHSWGGGHGKRRRPVGAPSRSAIRTCDATTGGGRDDELGRRLPASATPCL